MLGEELAGDIFKRLDTDDIRLLSRGMAEIPQLEDEQEMRFSKSSMTCVSKEIPCS